jgi:branched-chain amino acid aminotransferase
MMIVSFNPVTGWSAPEIKPYAPLVLDPASSCFQYCPSVFEGMKAYRGPDGAPRLFRPQLNMARIERSAERVALPVRAQSLMVPPHAILISGLSQSFSSSALLTLIKKFVSIEQRWIPDVPGSALYLRPTLIGTRPALGVCASDHAVLYVLASPTGPFFSVPRPLRLWSESAHTRSWPGGTGAFKLGLNYAPGFAPQRAAALRGYDQVLWLLDEGALLDGEGEAGQPERCRVTEAGAMNIFFVLSREGETRGDDLEVVTPRLDGTILPGITRASVLALAEAHPSQGILPGVPASTRLFPVERRITMADVYSWHASGRLREVFCAGTAVTIAPVGVLGFSGREELRVGKEEGLGVVGAGLKQRIVNVQEGREEWEGWCVRCE